MNMLVKALGLLLALSGGAATAEAASLDEIKQRGVIKE